ncbi:hypothetical protein Mal64_21190 [Pseudobythopirellula maris]|uniref:Uncharacterized protein n=1 Tax=Pseudobythopirellula maris TaxID=2527991 RepID=A0A5C5ZQR5_9BACT|nr:hypothetical protein [Pseudobythopirellula maris]TWT88633.1 hypothetical protein Mal64_21190 [Pseudobythopirellula maris]
MFAPKPHQPESHGADQVDHLMRNAELRNELEPLYDESIASVNVDRMTTLGENDFLESMLAWERAPMAPIAEWFDPPMRLPHPDSLNPQQLNKLLGETIERFYAKRIILDFTDHLSDRELYTLIGRSILPAYEKKFDRGENFLHWDCADTSGEPETWLRYYASDEERAIWSAETDLDPPPREAPPHRRELPQAPL